jgi:hypothetical protein
MQTAASMRIDVLKAKKLGGSLTIKAAVKGFEDE